MVFETSRDIRTNGPKVIKLFSMLNSTEHGISTAKMLKIKDFSCFQTLRCQQLLAVLIFMSMINFS